MVWTRFVGSRLARLCVMGIAGASITALVACESLDPKPETDRFGKVASDIRKTLETRARKLSYKKPGTDQTGTGETKEDVWGPIVIGEPGVNQDLFTGLSNEPLDIQLRFNNADIRQVASTILSDLLAVEYTMDPALSGPINLETNRGVSPRSLIIMLREAVDRIGGVLDRDQGLYRIRLKPGAAAGAAAGLGGDVTFVPVLKTSAGQIKELLDKVFPGAGTINVDDARNRLIVQGPAAKRRQISAAIREFDTDLLSGKRVAILPVRKAEAKNVLSEIQGIMGVNRAASPIRLFLVERMNGILAVAPTRDQVDRIWDLVRSLDRVPAVGQQLHIIELQHTRASEIAELLSKTISREAEVTVVGAQQASGPPAAGGAPPPAAAAPAPRPQPGTGSGPRIVAHESANTLLVYGTAEQFALVEHAVTRLDVPAPQVLIEATILEVTLNDQLQFGVQGFLEKDKDGKVAGFFSGTSQALTGTFPGFNFIYSSQGSVRAVITALKDVTDVTILSSPQVVTVNHGLASLEVGDEVPLLVRQVEDTTDPTAPTVNSVEYRQTGVILKVTPHINKDSLVTLDITQEVTSVPSTDTSDLTPTLSRRVIQTRASVHSGQPIALGGLISEQVTDDRNRTPILGELPLVGALFGTTNTALQRTELLVILTPTVFTSEEETNAITLELLERLRSVKDEIRKEHEKNAPGN